MLSLDALNQAVAAHWAAAGPDLPTRHADQRLASDRLAAWTELWVLPLESQPTRAAADHVTVEVLVHLFVQPRESRVRIEQLADAARAALARQTLPVADGWLRLGEVELRDLSRDDDADGLAPRHLVLIARGDATQ